MTDLDGLLKSRDITLTTKVHIVKAMVFPEVMYGYESWTIKKADYPNFPKKFSSWLFPLMPCVIQCMTQR